MGKITEKYFSIVNTNDEPVLFKTQKPDVNKLRFSIINSSATAMTLKGGPLSVSRPSKVIRVDKSGAPIVNAGTGTYFTIDFETILPAAVVNGMDIGLPDGWDKLYVEPTSKKPPAWIVGPTQDVTLKPREAVEITISNFICETTDPGNFEVAWKNIPDYTDSRSALPMLLSIISPVDPDKKTLPLSKGFINPVHPIQGQAVFVPDTATDDPPVSDPVAPIYITYNAQALIENGFSYFLHNATDDPIVKSDIPIDPQNPPLLYFSFVFGTEDYAVTTQELADNNIEMALQTTDSQWSLSKHLGGSPSWMWTAKSEFFLNAHETVYFIIKKIITPLNVAPDKISIMYIQINNVPGYNDAAFFLPLQKLIAHAGIEPFKVNKSTINYGENVVLNWNTELAYKVTLEYRDRDGNEILLSTEKGDIRLNEKAFTPKIAPTAENTVFILKAYDAGETPVQKSVNVFVKQPVADIETFSSDLMLVDVTKPAGIQLTWKVNNAQKVVLKTPDGENPVDRNGGTQPYTLQNTSVFTLFAYSYGTEHSAPVSKVIRVYAYKPGAPVNLPFTGDAMQSWPSVLVNNARKEFYAADGGNKTIYRYDVETGDQKAAYSGVAMAVSDNGSKLFVYNTDPNKFGVSMIDTGNNAISAPVGFGPVYLMIANPSLTKLYCAATNNVDTVTRLMINAAGNQLSSPQYITVGTSPRAMVFNKDASKLYVANYKTNNISVIETATDKIKPNVDIQVAEPNSFAYHADKNKLYIAGEGSNVVVLMDTLTDDFIKNITVGNRPSKALLSPNGKYVYIANYGGNTVSVIDTDSDEVVSTLTVGTAPIAMALNGDGNLFFVGNYCSRTLSVVDINNNIVLPQALSTGDTNGNPFDIAVFTEGNDYTRVYVGKESFAPRISCSTPNNGLGVTVYSIQKPGR